MYTDLIDRTESFRLFLARHLDLLHYIAEPHSRLPECVQYWIVFNHDGRRLWFQNALPLAIMDHLVRKEEDGEAYMSALLSSAVAAANHEPPTLYKIEASRKGLFKVNATRGARSIEFRACKQFLEDHAAFLILVDFKFSQQKGDA